MDNNTKLEQITNFILEQNNNKFSIQAFLKKVILEEINFTDDNIVYLAERFGDRVDVESFVFIKEIYDKLIENNIFLLKEETEIDDRINTIINASMNDYFYNNLTPKTIAIKHHIRNKKINTTIDINPLYERVLTVNNKEDRDKLLQQYLELSKTIKEPFYIHFNDGKHSSFFVVYNGKYVYVDSIASRYSPSRYNQILQDVFLGLQNIKTQTGLGCRICTGIGMVILDEYIKKYGIENLEELNSEYKFSEGELKVLNEIKNIKPTEDELRNELKILNSTIYNTISKISSLINIRSSLNNKKHFLVIVYLISKIRQDITDIIKKENKEQLPSLQELSQILIKNIKTTILDINKKYKNTQELSQLQKLEKEIIDTVKTTIQTVFEEEKINKQEKTEEILQLQQIERQIFNCIDIIKQNTIEERIQKIEQSEIKLVNNIKSTLQNTINQEKQENEDNISFTEQSLLKLLQLIDPKRESMNIDKDFEEIILLLNRVDLINNKVLSLTHLLFPLAQTMTLVNSYIDHNEKLKESDIRIKDIKDKVKVNHFVNDFREDIKLRFDKIEELSKRINEQRLQDMKFFETSIEELLINEEKEETEQEEIEEKDKTTQEKLYPDFIYQNGNENIIALLEAVMDSTEIFDKYCNKDKKVIINN